MLDEVYKLRSQVEENVRGVFAAQDIFALTRQNMTEKFQHIRPRVEIKCKLGAATGRRETVTGFMRYDAFHFSLGIQTVVNQQNAAGNPKGNMLPEDYVGRVRAVMAELAQTSWNRLDLFPLVLIAEPLRDLGTDDPEPEGGVEHTGMAFEGIVCIRRTAWTN